LIVIELEGIFKQYPESETPAVSDISFQVEEGETLALLGPSGSGKTTILRLIAGFEKPDKGRVLLRGRDVCEAGRCLPPEKRGIGMVFQDYALFPHLTVEGNIGFGLRGLKRSKREDKVHEILEMVGLPEFCRRYPHELSGGQQQRIALARALAPDPLLILLDEPFSHLDPDMRTQMRGEVSSILQRAGATAILVTHDHEEAFSMASKIALLNNGQLEQHASPEAIYHTPLSPFVADFVGQADFITGRIQGETILSEIGPLQNKTALKDEKEVMLMIRPDDIDLTANPEGMARVVGRQFRGSENLYAILLPSGELVHSSQHSLAVYPLQSRVDIKLKLTHTVAFSKESVERYRQAQSSKKLSAPDALGGERL